MGLRDKRPPVLGDLDSIDFESGVAEDGRGFVKIRAAGTHDGRAVVLLGQLDPSEVEAHALAYMQAAEAARQDAAVLRTLRRVLGGSPAAQYADMVAGEVIVELRKGRA